jgi:Glycosyl transferase family 2
MKLFTAIYNDARLLRHFLRHYDSAGVTEFYIATSAECASEAKAVAGDYNVGLFEQFDVHDSLIGGNAAVTKMRRLHQAENEWSIIVDLDEFIEFSADIEHIISAVENEGANVVRGIMYDRFTADGKLADFNPDSDLSKLYPVRARFIAHVMQGADYKGVLVKGQLRAAIAHHRFVVEHAYREVKNRGIPWAIEYRRILDHYQQHGRMAWEEFGGELIGPDRPQK